MKKVNLTEFENDNTQSLSEICNRDYGPLKWLIPDIIPMEGVTMLVGSPKAGKSLLILNIIITYLLGDVILKFFPPAPQPIKILHLDLEGSHRRTKSRVMRMIGGQPFPPGLVVTHTWARFGSSGSGLKKLHTRLELEHFDLIIIDTLGKIQSIRKISNVHSYSLDEQEIDKFVTICKRFQTSIILLHHTRKTKSDDWVDMVSGSHGISGTVDTLLYLYREKGQTGSTLHVAGRDVEEESYRLAFDKATNSYEMIGSTEDILSPLTKAKREMVELLNLHEGMMEPKEIAAKLGKTIGAVKMMLANLLKDDLIVRYGHGQYGKRIKL